MHSFSEPDGCKPFGGRPGRQGDSQKIGDNSEPIRAPATPSPPSDYTAARRRPTQPTRQLTRLDNSMRRPCVSPHWTQNGKDFEYIPV